MPYTRKKYVRWRKGRKKNLGLNLQRWREKKMQEYLKREQGNVDILSSDSKGNIPVGVEEKAETETETKESADTSSATKSADLA